MAETANEALVRKLFETLSEGDLEKMRPLLHDEATWQAMGMNIPGSGIHRTPQGIIDLLSPVRGMFHPGEPKIKINRLFSKDDYVCAETEAMGTMNNGKKYHNRYCWSIEIKDGKVLAVREYMDTAYIQSLVG